MLIKFSITMSNRRLFLKQLTSACIIGIPTVVSPKDSKSLKDISPNYLELVSPESLGMDSEILKEVNILIEETIAIGHTPGAVVAIGRGNKMSFLKGYGFRQFYPEKEKITLDTLFDLASVTKVAATATAVAVMINQGKISPDDLVTKYFPEFGVNGKEKITIRNLFTHTTGIDSYSKDVTGTKEYLFSVLCSLGLIFPVGERFDYNDNNILMLGHIVEKLSGKNLRDFTIENLYTPLGMLDTMFNPGKEHRARTAATEMRDGKWFKGIVNDFNTYNLGGIAGDTGLFSTAPDLAILSALWLGKGTLVKKDGVKVELFSPKTFEIMTDSYFVDVGVRGIIWDKRSGSKNRPWNMSPAAIGHGGWTGTSIWIDPKLNLFVVVLGNSRHPFGQTPNIYPTAASVGVVAVNSIIQKDEDLALYYNQDVKFSIRPKIVPISFKNLKGKKIGLIISKQEIDKPDGLLIKLKNFGIDIAALYYPAEDLTIKSYNQYYQAVPLPEKTEELTGAPVYALTMDCPRILPPMLNNSETILFGINVPNECSEELFWFITNVLGHTLQSAADHKLNYAIIDYPNPLEKRFVGAKDLTDKLKSFGSYSRHARQFGLSFCDIASKINEDQSLEVNINSLSENELLNI